MSRVSAFGDPCSACSSCRSCPPHPRQPCTVCLCAYARFCASVRASLPREHLQHVTPKPFTRSVRSPVNVSRQPCTVCVCAHASSPNFPTTLVALRRAVQGLLEHAPQTLKVGMPALSGRTRVSHAARACARKPHHQTFTNTTFTNTCRSPTFHKPLSPNPKTRNPRASARK